VSEVKNLRWWLSSICTNRYSADDLMNSHGSIKVVRKWCDIFTNLVLRCFDSPEGLGCGNLLVGVFPELANSIRLSTAVLSQDLSGAWVTIRGVRAS
jgi:hypothetical protein